MYSPRLFVPLSMKISKSESAATANLDTTARAKMAKIETVGERHDVSRVLVPSRDISAIMLPENTPLKTKRANARISEPSQHILDIAPHAFIVSGTLDTLALGPREHNLLHGPPHEL